MIWNKSDVPVIFVRAKAAQVSTFNLVMLNKLRCHTATSDFQPIRLLDPDCWYKFSNLMANSADPDQLASSEANWSGSTLFAKAGYIQVQQD